MRLTTTLVLLALVLVGAAAAARGDESPAEAARKVAETWLPLVDEGRYGESYEALAENAREDYTRPEWEAYLAGVRRPLGKLKSRAVLRATFVTSLPGIEGRQGAVIEYESSFEKKNDTRETLTLLLEGDAWRVASYVTGAAGTV